MKCEIDLHNGALACSEQNTVSEHCQVSSGLPANNPSLQVKHLSGSLGIPSDYSAHHPMP